MDMKVTPADLLTMSLDQLHTLKKVLLETMMLMDKPQREKFTKNNITAHVRRQLRAIRRQNHWSQEEMAEKIGVTRSRYCSLETGKANMSLVMSTRLANLLDCTVQLSLVPFEAAIENKLQLDSDVASQTQRITPYHQRRSSYERTEEFVIQEIAIRARKSLAKKMNVPEGAVGMGVSITPDRLRELSRMVSEDERKILREIEVME
jgi:transcriptional regulator with XRE-family HTH domain